jgi:hypothetical protein
VVQELQAEAQRKEHLVVQLVMEMLVVLDTATMLQTFLAVVAVEQVVLALMLELTLLVVAVMVV